jgi:hypothetical protein
MNRKERLKTLIGHLVLKYDINYNSVSHTSFMVKPEDIIYIIENYSDVINDSNLYLSLSVNGIWWRRSTTDFKMTTTERYITISQAKKYDTKDHYEVLVDYYDVVEIKTTISCGSILSFDLKNKEGTYIQISCRND